MRNPFLSFIRDRAFLRKYQPQEQRGSGLSLKGVSALPLSLLVKDVPLQAVKLAHRNACSRCRVPTFFGLVV